MKSCKPIYSIILDVRRNVRCRATRVPRWVHENYRGRGISIDLEIKKFFMDEWTGKLDEEKIAAIGDALCSTSEAGDGIDQHSPDFVDELENESISATLFRT